MIYTLLETVILLSNGEERGSAVPGTVAVSGRELSHMVPESQLVVEEKLWKFLVLSQIYWHLTHIANVK